MNTSTLHTEKKDGYCLKVFLMGLLVGAVALAPFIVYDKGLFLYYGDFNVQQIPFYQLAHDAVRSGNIWWNWHTDLGANFIGSYSFYLLFSPFFWLTVPFPTEALPYLMAPLIVLKSACAALTAYLYIRRFVRKREIAAVTSLLYAYSGYAVYNIFFNHFHEAIVFFPLMLVGLEKTMTENKKGPFALAVAVNAIVNYWFFIGEAVFAIIYFFVRFADRSWRVTAKKFIRVFFEAVIGVGMAMAALLPSVLAIMGNPRTGTESILNDVYLWYYSNPQRYLGIIHSFFYAPDMPALNNMFPSHGAQWSSLSAYIPIFGMVFVVSYIIRKGARDWVSKMIIAGGVISFVPLFNHLFVLLNNSYYTRWFYMPTLIMVMATARELSAMEDMPEQKYDRRGLKITSVVICLLITVSALTPKLSSGKWSLGIYNYSYMFLATTLITLGGLLATVFFIGKMDDKSAFRRRLIAVICVGCCIFTFGQTCIGKVAYPDNRWITEQAIPGRNQMLPEGSDEDEFVRADIFEGDDNLGMYWNLPNIQAFHSIVPVSLMEFYPKVGIKRDVSSKPSVNYYALRDFLSVKYLYINENKSEQSPMPGYELVDNKYGYNIYENLNYIPMGFAFDEYMDEESFNSLGGEQKTRNMLRAIYLSDEAIERNADIIRLSDKAGQYMGESDVNEAVQERRSMACYSFEINKDGFAARSNLDAERLMLFSVPYDAGWSAKVNGKDVIIEQADIGFMAVRVPADEAEIIFVYRTPGLKAGIAVTLFSVLIFAVYMLWWRKKEGRFFFASDDDGTAIDDGECPTWEDEEKQDVLTENESVSESETE